MSGFGALGDLAWDEAPVYAYPEEVLGDDRAGVGFIAVAEIYPVNLGVEGAEAQGSFPIGDLPLSGDAGVEALYFATEEWATSPSDVPPNQPFDGRLSDPLRFSQSLLSGERFAGFALGGGSLRIDNDDGAYDSFITGYGLDGRRVVVKIGRRTDPYSSFVPIFEGTASDWRGDLFSIEVILRDNGFKLDAPAQPTVYAGTGADEGGADLEGKRRPLLLGEVEHGPLALVDPAYLIYQANDGAIGASIEILDRGVALTPNGANQASYAALEALAVGAGEFELYPAGGYVKLGAAPDGQVTFRGATGFGLATTAEIVRQLLVPTTLLDPQEIDEDSFDALDTAQPADVGLFLAADGSGSTADAIADLLLGIGAFGAFDRLGRMYLRRVDAPAGEVADSFDATDIVALNREALPPSLAPPPWRVRAAYQRNFAPLSGGDLAPGVDPADRTALQGESLLAQASDPAVLTGHPLAQDPDPIESWFADKADAEDEAERLLFLFAAGRSLWRFRLPRRALLLELGDVVNVSYGRFGLAGGRDMIVLDKRPVLGGAVVAQVEVVAYG